MMEKVAWGLLGAAAGACVLVAVTLVVYLGGYEVGLWSATCRLAHHQPKCVRAGWGQSVKVIR